MGIEDTRRLVWEALLDADYHARYFGALANSIQKRETLLTVCIAASSSAAVLAVLAELLGATYAPVAIKVLAGIAAIGSILLLAHKLGKKASMAAAHHRKWSELRTDFNLLWTRLDELSADQVREEWKSLEHRHGEMDQVASQDLPWRKHLAKVSQKATIKHYAQHLQA